MRRSSVKRLLAATALVAALTVPAAALPIGGNAPPAAPPGDQLTALLASNPCTNCWLNAGSFVATAPTINSVVWGCAAQPCAGAPSNAPTAATIRGASGPSAITFNWAGGELDTDDEMLIVWGGGHQGYWGNELYAFKLATLKWSRLSVPSDITGYDTVNGAGETYPSDGMPVSAHTYDSQTYIPGLGQFSIGNCGQANGGCSGDSFKVLPSTLNPAQFNKWVAIPTFNPAVASIDAMAHFDPTTNAIYATSNSNALYKLASPFTGSWVCQGTCNDQTLSFHQTGAIQPGTVMAVTGGNSDNAGAGLRVWSLSTGNLSHIGWLGDSTIPNANAPGFVWDPHASKFVGWAGGTTVYLLDPATWTFTAHTISGANTVTPACTDGVACAGGQSINGTFGRMQYDAAHNCIILVNSVLDPVYVYKPDFLRRRWRRGERKPPRRARAARLYRRPVRRAA